MLIQQEPRAKHYVDADWKFKEVATSKVDVPMTMGILSEDDIWICDSGASSHSTKSEKGARNKKGTFSTSVGHTGPAIKATSSIDVPGRFLEKDGSSGIRACLTDVSFNEGLNFNLLSLSRMLVQGWKISSGNASGIQIQKGENVIKFDIVIPTAKGAIIACRFIRDSDINATSTETGVRMGIEKAHRLLGHGDENSTRLTAKKLGWVITPGKLKPCEHCAKAKAKQKNVTKRSDSAAKAEKPGERVYLDLSKVTVAGEKGEVELNKKYWKIIVNEKTGKKWSEFSETKNGMVEPTCEWLNKMKTRKIPVKVIRLDPGGENVKLEKRCSSQEWQNIQPIEFEFTSRDTPQHNSLAEVAFPYLAGKARAMMGAANIPPEKRRYVVVEALKCATQLDGLRVIELVGETGTVRRMTRDEWVLGANPKWVVNLRTFGECGIVKEGKNKKSVDRGIAMMFVGYPANREEDSVRMWNEKTNGVVTTRDVIWMKRMFYEKAELGETIGDGKLAHFKTEAKEEESLKEESDDDEVPAIEYADESDDESEAEEADDSVASDSVRLRDRTAIRAPERWTYETMASMTEGMLGTAAELRYLGSMCEADNYELCTTSITSDNVELAQVGAGLGGGFENTQELKVMNYKEAMRSPDKEHWIEEVGNEKLRFDKFNAVTPVPRSQVPSGSKIMTTTWAMKKKTNGKFRGRLNARGYEQIDGKHYHAQNIAAPVTNANTVRIVVTLLCMNAKWIAEVVDVEGAFLQGKFKDGEELWIEIPDGMDKYYGDRKDTVLKMNVPLYGTKQAAHCFYVTLVEEIKKREYKRSKADPCLYYITTAGRLSVIVSWVDDLILLGEQQDVDMMKADLSKAFICKEEGPLKEFVGSKIDFSRNENGLGTAKFTQPVLVQKLEDEYLGDVSVKPPKTPAVAGLTLVKGDESGQLNEKDSTEYRSATATCMFMMQWSRPDIFNATRGQARHMHAPREPHKTALEKLMRYIVGTKERGLVIKPDELWDGTLNHWFVIGGRSDSDYAANTDDRRSISGGRVFLNKAPVTFRSQTQKFVTLSVTEAEGAAGVMVAQDMLYVYRLLLSIGLKVKIPMILEMDNKGAVDLANNWSVGGRTRHVDVRNHFLRDLKDEGLLVVKHVPGVENDADIFTKNVTGPIFQTHLPVFVGIDKYMEKESEAP